MPATGKYTRKHGRDLPSRPRNRHRAPTTITMMFRLFIQELLLISHPTQQSYNRMERARIAAYSAKGHWIHLRNCLREQVLPKSMRSSKDTNALGAAFPYHHQTKLQDALVQAYLTKQEKFAYLHYCKRVFRYQCPQHIYLQGLNFAYNVTMEKGADQTAKHADQLQRLCESSSWSTASLLDCVVNLSTYTLSVHEHQLLGLGLAFSLPPRAETVTDILASLQDLQSRAKDIAPELQTIKGFALTGLNELVKPIGGLPRRLYMAKQSLQRNPDIIILKADKGNKVCVLDKKDYIKNGEEML